MSDDVTVIQADREAAANLLLAQDMVANDGADWVRAGHLDHGPSVQAFAKHRLSTPSPDSGERMREAAQRVVDEFPAAAGKFDSIEGADGKAGWGSIRALAAALQESAR